MSPNQASSESKAAAGAKLFVSYAREDQAVARRLCDALESRGRDLWVDWEGIPPSAEWLAEIEKGIRAADAFVFMLSPDSLTSDVCRQELDIALSLNKRLVPVVLRDAGDTPIPPDLARLNWIFLRETDDFDTALEELIEALDTDLDWLHRHTALLVPALAWQDAGREASRLLKGRALQQAESWLEASAGKTPPPAQVQIEFIQASRRAATRRLRMALTGALAGIITMVVLVVWALIAEKRAERARDEAVARRLAAESSLVAGERDALIETSALLAIESWHRRPALDNDEPLRRALRLLPEPAGGWIHKSKPIVDAVFVSNAGMFAYAVDKSVYLGMPSQADIVGKLDHDSPVRELAGCPSTKVLATRTSSGQVTLWNAANGKRAANLILRGRVTAIECSSDGTHLAVGDTRGGVSIFGTHDGKLLRPLKSVLNSPVGALRFSPGGRYVAGGGKAMLQVWRRDDGRPVAAIPHRYPVEDIDFDPGGRRIVTASFTTAYVRSLPSGELIKRIDYDTNVFRARFSHNGKELLLGCNDGAVFVWDVDKYVHKWDQRHQDPVWHVGFSVDGQFILTASNDGTARLWRHLDKTEQLRFTHDGHLTAARISPDAKYILTAGKDGRVRLWHNRIPDRELLPKANYDRRVSNDTRFQIESKGNGRWQLLFLDDTRDPFVFNSEAKVLGFAVSSNLSMLAVVHDDVQIDVWSISDGKHYKSLSVPQQILTLGFHPDSKRLLTGSRDGRVRLWSLADGDMIWQNPHEMFVMTHAFSPDGRRVATGGTDRMARVWNTDDGRLIQTLEHNHDVRALAFSPDGNTLASASSDQMARLWRLDTGEILHSMEHRNPVLSIAYDEKSNLIATGSTDETARLWDAATGLERLRIFAPPGVMALGFTSDGRLRIYTGFEMATHAVDGADLVKTACKRLTRNMDLDSWELYVGNEPPRATCPNLPPPEE